MVSELPEHKSENRTLVVIVLNIYENKQISCLKETKKLPRPLVLSHSGGKHSPTAGGQRLPVEPHGGRGHAAYLHPARAVPRKMRGTERLHGLQNLETPSVSNKILLGFLAQRLGPFSHLLAPSSETFFSPSSAGKTVLLALSWSCAED